MEPEGSLLHSQVLSTCPYPEPDQPSPCTSLQFPEDCLCFRPDKLNFKVTLFVVWKYLIKPEPLEIRYRRFNCPSVSPVSAGYKRQH